MAGSFAAKISPQEAETLKTVRGITVVTGAGIDTGTDTIILGFNPIRDITKDQAVRQAAGLSIDRAAIAQVVMSCYADPTANLFPPSVSYAGRRTPVPARDVEAAKKVLEAAGWTGEGVRQKNGVRLALELVVSEDAVPGSRSLPEVLQSQLGETGFDVTTRQVDHATRHDDIPKMNLAVVRQAGARVNVMYLGRIVESGPSGPLYADHWHPYTTALTSAILGVNPKEERNRVRMVLKGDLPSPFGPPPVASSAAVVRAPSTPAQPAHRFPMRPRRGG